MASGGRRGFPVQRASDRGYRRGGGGEERSLREGRRHRSERGSYRGREVASRQFREEEFVVKERKAFGGRAEACNGRRNLSSSLGALQLEETTGRGGDERARSQRGSGGRVGKTPLDQLRRCEEKVSESIRQWREGRGRYEEVEHLSRSAWSQYARVLEAEMEVAVRETLGPRIWRNIHYPIVEQLRRRERGGGLLGRVLEEFTADYQSLLEGLQESQDFSLHQILSSGLDPLHARRHRKLVMLALIPCHWCLVSLGDLSRYQQQQATPPVWSKPRSYYLKAVRLAPKSGRPYNQLAVIAIKAHRRLDTVYYYMRSLFAKTPVESAHDNLVGLFEECSRKAESQQRERERERLRLERETDRRRKREERRERRKTMEREGDRHVIVFPSGQKEVWVVPGSVEWTERRRGRGRGEGVKEEVGEEGEGKSEAVSEESYSEQEGQLVRQLSSAFLLVHAKLYTKIGIGELEVAEGKLLQLWRRVLRGRPGLETAPRLVKMTTINICSLHHSLHSSDSESGQSYYFNLAFHVAVLLATDLVDSCWPRPLPSGGGGAEEGVTSDLRSVSEEQLSVALPGVRVWLLWVARQENLWQSLLSHKNRKQLATLLVRLRDTLSSFQAQVSATALPDLSSEWAGLWEDGMLTGFMPLKSEVSTETYLATPSLYKLTSEQRREQDLLRQSLLSRTCDSLWSHAHCYEVGGASDRDGERDGQDETEEEEEREEDSGEDVLVEGYSEEGEEEEEEEEVVESDSEAVGGDGDSNIERLKAEKERLSLEIRQRCQALTTTQTVLQEAVAEGEREVVVCARHLVPDTNGFVDQLPSIRTLVACGHFILAVPLVVVTELEGLSKGAEEQKKEGERGRGEGVMAGAKEAVSYIRQVMGPTLQILTTRGSLLQSLSFTAELTGKASNDDLILQSSLSLHHKLSSPGPSPLTVVLLTDDRNLRVKAHAARLPVKDIPQFMNISRLT